MSRRLGVDDCDPNGIERPVVDEANVPGRPVSLSLTPRSSEILNDWRTEAIATAVGVNGEPNVEPLSSLTSCLVLLLQMGGVGYSESASLIVVDTDSGLTVGLRRDRKGVCSLNS